MYGLLLGSTSASLGLPALCALSVPHSWAYQKHIPESTPLQATGIPPGHPETFCCSWQFCVAASGPSPWVYPLDNFHFHSTTCCGTRRSRLLPPLWLHQGSEASPYLDPQTELGERSSFLTSPMIPLPPQLMESFFSWGGGGANRE